MRLGNNLKHIFKTLNNCVNSDDKIKMVCNKENNTSKDRKLRSN